MPQATAMAALIGGLVEPFGLINCMGILLG
jgi:hypothetical protein